MVHTVIKENIQKNDKGGLINNFDNKSEINQGEAIYNLIQIFSEIDLEE